MVYLDLWKNNRSVPGSLFNTMRDVFEDFNNLASFENSQTSTPACDIEEDKDNYLITLDVPGFKKEDIHIEVSGQQLIISGERKRENESKEGNVHRKERVYGKFSRTFTLPENIKSENIHAPSEDGVLKIELPKAEAAKPRKIEIANSSKGILNKPKAVNS